MLSLIVLTHNEEIHLERCLKSVADLTRHIFVVDSFSNDATVDIARLCGAQVAQRPFKNNADQFQWALDNLPFNTPWILRLDADEYLTPELAKEIQEKLPSLPPEITGVYMKRRMFFLGKWIRHGTYYPLWLLRIFRHGVGKVESRWMDEHIVLDYGQTMRLEHDLVDDNHKGLIFWSNKHIGYARREALDYLEKTQLQQGQIASKFWGHQEERKRWLKENLYYRIPLFVRPFLYFIYRYFLRLGILDGLPGFIFHFLQAFWYRFLVDALIFEAKYLSPPK